MNRRIVITAARAAVVELQKLTLPPSGSVRVANTISALSAGSEGLVWRGEMPEGLPLDTVLPGYQDGFLYPACYGYSAVGRIEAVGPGVNKALLGRRVFTFTQHQSFCVVPQHELVFLPDSLSDDDAVFLAAMETAVSLVHDAAPVAGDRVALWGLGAVGLITASLLAKFPVSLTAEDPLPSRQKAALAAGVTVAAPGPASCDVALELSGNPLALSQALVATTFSGRVVLGSWYGTRPVALELGGSFHRSRIQLLASQVSTVSPELSGRWTKARRLEYALECLQVVRPSRWITHRFPPNQAVQAYQLAGEFPQDCLQVVFTF